VFSSGAPSIGTAPVPAPLQPNWLRGLELVTGALAIVLAFVALSDLETALALLVFLFAIALLFLGIQRLTRSAASSGAVGWHRSLDGVIGVFSIVAAFVVLVLPGVAILTLVLLLYIGLLVIGIGWLGLAFGGSHAPTWFRAAVAAFGLFAILAAIIALVEPAVAILTLVLLLAVVLLFLGVGDVIAGWTGRPYKPLLPLSIPGFPPMGPPGSPPAGPPSPPPAG